MSRFNYHSLIQQVLMVSSERMYKTRFGKWGWRKYNSKSHLPVTPSIPKPKSCMRARQKGQRIVTRLQPLGRSEELQVVPAPGPSEGLAQTAVPRAMLHCNVFSRQMDVMIFAVRRYIQGCSGQNTHWQHTNKFDVFNKALSSRIPFICAIHHFANHDHKEGGQAIRQGFLSVEGLIDNDFPFDFFELAVGIPHLLLASGHRDICLLYANYLGGLVSLNKERQQHPLHQMAVSLRILAQSNAEQLQSQLIDLFRLWADQFARVRGFHDRNTLGAFNRCSQFLGEAKAKKVILSYQLLLRQAIREYSEGHEIPTSIEGDILCMETKLGLRSEDFVQRHEKILELLSRSRTPIKETDWEWSTYNNCNRRLSIYFLRMGDLERSVEYLKKCIGSPRDCWYLQELLRLEELFRQLGNHRDADDIRLHRLQPTLGQA